MLSSHSNLGAEEGEGAWTLDLGPPRGRGCLDPRPWVLTRYCPPA